MVNLLEPKVDFTDKDSPGSFDGELRPTATVKAGKMTVADLVHTLGVSGYPIIMDGHEVTLHDDASMWPGDVVFLSVGDKANIVEAE